MAITNKMFPNKVCWKNHLYTRGFTGLKTTGNICAFVFSAATFLLSTQNIKIWSTQKSVKFHSQWLESLHDKTQPLLIQRSSSGHQVQERKAILAQFLQNWNTLKTGSFAYIQSKEGARNMLGYRKPHIKELMVWWQAINLYLSADNVHCFSPHV